MATSGSAGGPLGLCGPGGCDRAENDEENGEADSGSGTARVCHAIPIGRSCGSLAPERAYPGRMVGPALWTYLQRRGRQISTRREFS
jgi:hypothetical protein